MQLLAIEFAKVDFGAIVQIAFLVLGLLAWVISQLKGEAQKGPKPKPQRPRNRPPAAAPAAANDQVDAFLRKALERRRAGQGEEVEVVQRPTRPQRQKPRRPKKRQAPQTEHLPAVDQADERMEAHLHEVFDHKVGTIGKGSKRLEGHVQEVFDHTVGTLGTISPAAQASHKAVSPLAREVVAMFQDPLSVRKAFVLSEILKPLEDR